MEQYKVQKEHSQKVNWFSTKVPKTTDLKKSNKWPWNDKIFIYPPLKKSKNKINTENFLCPTSQLGKPYFEICNRYKHKS